MKRIRVGIIGASPDRGWAAQAHIRALKSLSDDFEITALATSRRESADPAAKLFGERMGKCYAATHALSVIAIRIGWVRPGENPAREIPLERGPWFRLMWLSNRDYCQLIERCIEAGNLPSFVILNGMSANTGMRWDIETTRRLVGYEPQDDVAMEVP